MIVPEPYNKIQINYSIDKASDGSVLKTSLMVNIREDEVSRAVQLYEELKTQLNGNGHGNASANGNNGKSAVKENGNAKGQNGKENGNTPECSRHHIKMWIRSRRSDGAMFYGCPMFDKNGCLEKFPYPYFVPGRAEIKIPVIQY